MSTRIGALAAVLVLAVLLGADASAQKRRRLVPVCDRCDASGGGSWSEVVNGGGKCLDANESTRRTNGGMVHLWTCTGDESQQWQWRGASAGGNRALVNHGGLCLAAAEARVGGAVQVRVCNGSPDQQWRFVGGALMNARDYCLDAHVETLQQDGGRVQVWGCAQPPGQPPQSWQIQPLGEPVK